MVDAAQLELESLSSGEILQMKIAFVVSQPIYNYSNLPCCTMH
jgi:hypothetical protein